MEKKHREKRIKIKLLQKNWLINLQSHQKTSAANNIADNLDISVPNVHQTVEPPRHSRLADIIFQPADPPIRSSDATMFGETWRKPLSSSECISTNTDTESLKVLHWAFQTSTRSRAPWRCWCDARSPTPTPAALRAPSARPAGTGCRSPPPKVTAWGGGGLGRRAQLGLHTIKSTEEWFTLRVAVLVSQ